MPAHSIQHYVPKFLLEQWHTGADDKLSVFRWAHGKLTHHRYKAKSVAQAEHLYSMQRSQAQPDVKVEKDFLGPHVDGPAAIIHKKILATGVCSLNDDDKRAWSPFLVSMMLRVPAMMQHMRELGRQTPAAGLEEAPDEYLIKEGAAALGRAYRVEPEVLANVFAGRLADVEMPKGLGSTPEIDKMVDTCRNLVTSIVKDEYANRGRFQPGSSKDDSFIALKSDGVVSPAKTELAVRMAFMESTIDAAVGKGAISELNAGMLKERIEAQVFQPRPPQSLQFSKEFLSFFEQRGKGIRIEAMKEVRGVTQSQTVREIAAKLKILMPAPGPLERPSDHRAHKPMER